MSNDTLPRRQADGRRHAGRRWRAPPPKRCPPTPRPGQERHPSLPRRRVAALPCHTRGLLYLAAPAAETANCEDSADDERIGAAEYVSTDRSASAAIQTDHPALPGLDWERRTSPGGPATAGPATGRAMGRRARHRSQGGGHLARRGTSHHNTRRWRRNDGQPPESPCPVTRRPTSAPEETRPGWNH